MFQNPTDEEIKELLKQARVIAVVGLSDKPERDSHKVAKYLQERGYRIIPVNPKLDSVLGEKAYKKVSDIPDEINIDILNVFRRSIDTPPVVEDSISKKPKAIWLQLGIKNDDAAKIAQDNNITIIMDRCIKIEHARLL
ncbi:CoA-binding protein [Peptococcaceae bacterium]|nr:CoA-binding protein [Peptococcaceae bacterium]MCL0043844.1 CoA-binding protein [Peptococcaceae bacterium]MCL0062673.1 CoA-binding protein [Peptococcaceae bacterium]MCL0077448.1 CoA-binding protein [Peptococcaceae bacterium]MCL0100376.1 CoA-binding protein [Peptococcaceae bacterium]